MSKREKAPMSTGREAAWESYKAEYGFHNPSRHTFLCGYNAGRASRDAEVAAAVARAEAAEAVIAEALKIEPAESKPSVMQGYELDQAFGYNEAREEFRDILSVAVLHPEPTEEAK